MLSFIEKYIKKNISYYQLNISLEEFLILGGKKASAIISTMNLMGSIEVLCDLTTDLLIVDIESENIIYSKTFEKIVNREKLNDIISQYLIELENFEKEYN